MNYYLLHQVLKDGFAEPGNIKEIPEPGVVITHHQFESEDAMFFLPGSDHLYCKEHKILFKDKTGFGSDHSSVLENSDFHITCNKSFRYHIIRDSSLKQAEGVIIMFHGLNEKKWDKYLPWAYKIALETRKAVLLFPIAFHMDRAPEAWSARSGMYAIAQDRGRNTFDNSECSYVNAAISSGLESNPQRLFWSGLQTYSDIIRLVDLVRRGEIPSVSPDAGIDLFGYSIGSFLSMILMMANPGNIFSNSRLFCFCGGMTIDRMNPVSKYIMDTSAAIALQKTFALLLNTDFSADPRLAHYMNNRLHQGESWFKSMLRYHYFQSEREERIRELQHRIQAFVLKQDTVTPPVEALNTLKGGYRDINVKVQIEDFPHPYSHITPFPLTVKNAEEVDYSFNLFIQAVSSFFKD